MKSREVEAILKRYGFELISQKGSHRKWRNSELGLQVIVPEHKGKDLLTYWNFEKHSERGANTKIRMEKVMFCSLNIS